MRLLPVLALPALALVALSGCAMVPAGPIVSQSRDIDAATSVVLNTWGDLTIREGEPSIVIEAPSAVLDRLTSSVDDGVLVLGVTPGTPEFLVGKISYELTLPSLEGLEINGLGDVDSTVPSGATLRLEVNGSGQIDIRDIDASQVTLQIAGTSNVDLRGRTDEFTVSVDGSATVRADRLESARVSVELNGIGDLTVAASATLDVSISGSGSVVYQGRPQVTQNISGVGSVTGR